jgi:DNA-binding response OmpR family regulator
MAATVLRGAGYKVLLASNGEQALSLFRTTTPELMLVSPVLPGVSGLELTYQVKQNPRTREVIAVALPATVTADAERAILAAGCDGYIPKPLDPVELIGRVREFLHPHTTAADGAAGPFAGSAEITLSTPEAEDLRRSFVSDGARRSRALLDSLNASFDALEARQAAQEWAGSAMALGFEEIAQRAGAVAQMLNTHPGPSSKLRAALMQLDDAFMRAAAQAEGHLPHTAAERLAGKRVAMVGFAEREMERICAALERVNALVRLFDASEPLGSATVENCSLILVHVREETLASPWLSKEVNTSKPLVLVGRGDALISLDAEVQHHACEFLIDGWHPEEVVMRLGLILSRANALPPAGPSEAQPQAKPAEVLLVDDDLSIRALVQAVFQKHGMVCRIAGNGAEGLEMIREHRPAAVLLDVNMPDSNGFEVLAAIRAQLPNVRVVMFTANQGEADVVRGFELGADDYIVKPFRVKELVARVKRLL